MSSTLPLFSRMTAKGSMCSVLQLQQMIDSNDLDHQICFAATSAIRPILDQAVSVTRPQTREEKELLVSNKLIADNFPVVVARNRDLEQKNLALCSRFEEMLGTAMAQLEASRQETRSCCEETKATAALLEASRQETRSCCEETKATAALLEASLRNNRVTADLLEESLRDNRVTAALLKESLQETRASRDEHQAYLVQSTAGFEAKKAAFDRILTAVAAEFTLVQTL